jgi:hypothetical protein
LKFKPYGYFLGLGLGLGLANLTLMRLH